MGSDDQSGARPAGPVVLRIKLRYDDVETMVSRFAHNVGKSGLFLPTKTMQPVGTEVKFELRIANDTAVLVGLGRVKHARPPDPARPKTPFGIGIELTRVSRDGRELILRMLERRRALGLPDVAIPSPDDPRGDQGSQPRTDTNGIVRDAMRDFASAPVGEQVLSVAPSGSMTGPIAVAKAAPVAEPAREPAVAAEQAAPEPAVAEPAVAAERSRERAAPAEPGAVAEPAASAEPVAAAAEPAREPAAAAGRAGVAKRSREQAASAAPAAAAVEAVSAAIVETAAVIESARIARASAPVPAVQPLTPERSRSTRAKPTDLLAQANELAARLERVTVPELDSSIDVDRALARARALAGSDLEGDLAQLRESSAAPFEITLEAASAELARQLGGKAIARRERSAKFDVPLATIATPTQAPTPTSSEPAASASGPVEAVRAESSNSTSVPVPSVSGLHDITAAIALEPLSTSHGPVAGPLASAAAAASAAASATPAEPAPEPELETGPAEPAAAAVPATAESAVAEPAASEPVATAKPDEDDDDPAREYVRDDKTRVPSGDVHELLLPPSLFAQPLAEPADDLEIPVEPPVSGGFSTVSEDDLRTTPGDIDELGARRAYESSPSLQLDDSDLEPVDDDDPDGRTHLGAFADAYPAADEAAAARLDRELEEAEAEAEAELGEMARGDEEVADGDVLAEANAHGDGEANTAYGDTAYGEAAYGDTAHGEAPYGEAPYGATAHGDTAHGDVADADPEAAVHPEPRAGSPFDAQTAVAFDAQSAAAYDAQVAELEAARAVGAAPEDFADRLAFDDDLDREEARNFPTANPRPGMRASSVDIDLDDAADDFSDEGERAGSGYPQPPSASDLGYLNAPSDSFTFAEPLPGPGISGEDFDEPHGFTQNTPVPARRSRASEDSDTFEQHVRQSQPHAAHASGQRPLPGLPPETPPHGTPIVPAPATTPTGARSRTGANVIQRAAKSSTAAPPPIPAAARKSATTPPPLPVRSAPRASSDDGILIDFDDDE
jgi:uncharacterized protein (TIGR02266 family)